MGTRGGVAARGSSWDGIGDERAMAARPAGSEASASESGGKKGDQRLDS